MDSSPDWGHARDYVRMQWLILQQDHAEDFVIATGKQYPVRKVVRWSAAELGQQPRFEGQGLNEVGIVDRIEGDRAPALAIGNTIESVDARYFLPAEVASLKGDTSRRREVLRYTRQPRNQPAATPSTFFFAKQS